MLVLSRKAGERIVIGDSITLVVNKIAGNRVSIGIEAPADVHIVRGELERMVHQFRDSLTEASADEPLGFVQSSGGARMQRAPR